MLELYESFPGSEAEDGLSPYAVSSEVWMVPCTVDVRNNVFVPMSRPADESAMERGTMRQAWTSKEDEALQSIITLRGTKAWTSVAAELNMYVHQGRQRRHGKQCRERWFNHLDPNLRKGNWTAAEDLLILEKQLELGNHWSEISKLLTGRNENNVKNRWKSMTKKAEKELPPGTDIVRWLISERKDRQVETTECVNEFPPVREETRREAAPLLPLPMRSANRVRKRQRTLEQPEETIEWEPFQPEETEELLKSPSLFLSI